MKIYPARIDPLTGENFTPTRKNQVYATRENQVRFNNKKKASKSKLNQTADKTVKYNFISPKAINNATASAGNGAFEFKAFTDLTPINIIIKLIISVGIVYVVVDRKNILNAIRRIL
jgi:hypothetical protein